MRPTLEMMMMHPAALGRLCGFDRLTDALHGQWMQEMLLGREDLTLLAHRGSYKTTCLALVMAIMTLAHPQRNMLFLRKTEDDVVEVIRQVKHLLTSPPFRHLASRLYGTPVQVLKSDMYSVSTSCYAALRGAPQLLGMGIGGSLTGKHADLVFTDDIVNLQDRCSEAERQRTKGVYQELQNIRNPGGRIINTGTPWHPEDAISLMPSPRRFDCYATGLLTTEQIHALRQAMVPSLFAANYELRHIAREDALLQTPPRFFDDASLLRDGSAHVDAAYGGSDFTALTCGKRTGDEMLLYGRLWHKPVDAVMEEIISECNRLRCGPIYLETNADKGYSARDFRQRGAAVRSYHEHMNKEIKIGVYLRKWWPAVRLLEGTDSAYTSQLMGYSPQAGHDDAPDSAACLLRVLEKR